MKLIIRHMRRGSPPFADEEIDLNEATLLGITIKLTDFHQFTIKQTETERENEVYIYSNLPLQVEPRADEVILLRVSKHRR